MKLSAKAQIQEAVDAARERMANSPSSKLDGNLFEAIQFLADAIEQLNNQVHLEPIEHDGEGKLVF